ncbi:MAG: peptide ligase PGM1-related protein [Actinomycetota bacterium]
MLAEIDRGTIVVLPSLSFPTDELKKITGIIHYETRLLCTALWLASPDLRLVYITSIPIAPVIVDYYLELLPDPASARERLHLVALDDPRPGSLSTKLLARPDTLRVIQDLIEGPSYLLPFNVTAAESRLAEALEIPLHGPRPEHAFLGSKTGARRLGRQLGVAVLDGAEELRSPEDLEREIEALRGRRPGIGGVVVKLNEGFSGQGNVILGVDGMRGSVTSSSALFCAGGESWETYLPKMLAEGAIVEELVTRPDAVSPSAQLRIDETGRCALVSTHDQRLGGPGNQVYLGCSFPADPGYRAAVTKEALKLGRALADEGVTGFFGIDFIVVPSQAGPQVFLSEINLRIGGTTHPFLTAAAVTGGTLDPVTGDLVADGRRKSYVASDNVKAEAYVGLFPAQVIAAVRSAGLAFDPRTRSGATLHLLGALPEHGKFGVVCIAGSISEADELFHEVRACVDALKKET